MKKSQQKTPKSDTAPWMKWAYVGIALLVAVAMVGTYLAPMFEKKPTAQVGNTAVIGYTILSEDGRPLITTDQNLLASEYEKGNVVLLTHGLEMAAGGQVSDENIAVMPIVYPEITGFSGFGLLGFETNAISVGLVGMQAGETKTIDFSYGVNDLEMNLSVEDANGIGLNFTNTKVGDLVPLGLAASPDIPLGNETNETAALRFGEVVDKTDDSLVITHRYGSARVTLSGITG
ncbi:MAG: hypothetical protein M0P21_02495 [Methanoculleus sp.]|jgi:hypothetical protein|nr:hypothetical protein [Methanoculleus sp.]